MTDHAPDNTPASRPTADRVAASQGASQAHSPAASLGRVVGLWGGGVALVAIAIAWGRGSAQADGGSLSASAALGAGTVFVAALAGFWVLASLKARPIARWAFPVLGAQMLRTMLAPALGLAVYFLAPGLLMPVDAMAFWLTLLAVSAAMLAGETIAVAKMFGSASRPSIEGSAVAGREAVA